MDFISSIALLSAFAVFLIGFFVFLKNTRITLNQVFFIFSLIVSAWLAGTFFLISSCNIEQKAIYWDRFIYIGITFFPAVSYHLSTLFLKSKSQQKIVPFAYAISFIFLIISRTNYFINGLYRYEWGCHSEAQIGHHFFLIFFCLFIIIALCNIFKAINKSSDRTEQIQNKYAFISFCILSLGSLGFLPAYKISIYPIIYSVGLVSTIILSFAITRYHLFEVRVILTETLVGTMAIVLMILPFFMPDYSLKLLTGAILFFFLIFGFLLVKATHAEVRRKEEAESLLKAKTEFLSIASHQLRTPLTAIIGYSSMLKEGDYGTIPEKAGKAVTHIYDSSQRMIKLVNDFLSVSRMETGKTVLKIKENSMNELIEQVISELELRAKEKNLYVKYDQPATDHIAKIDPEKIKEVLSNLIDNAIHYTEKGGITVSIKKNNVKTTILVSDTGAGMTPEEIAKIFESFSRGSAGNKLNTQGSGLGLYIAKKFVEMHNGKIWATSEGKDRGSIFYVELPNK